MSRFANDRGRGGTALARHRTVFVADDAYTGMEDNDIRGYLDGGFVYGWNQPTQQHVRVGRWPWESPAPRYGEPELFRCLQRWGQLDLPPGARVTSAELSVVVNDSPHYSVQLFLYRVRRDWNPGSGGEQGDNTSPPRRGEVWWNAARAGELDWGLPGAGFGAAEHPDRDTDACPLAEVRCTPDKERLTFTSRPLTEYVGACVSEGRPCLLLLKLADVAEDRPGSLVDLYSANHGDTMAVARRPALALDWECPAEVHERRAVQLEYGRGFPGPKLECEEGDWVASSFHAAEGYEKPTIETRNALADGEPEWVEMRRPAKVGGDRLAFRIRAVTNPVRLGSSFRARVRDTWVTTGRPESRHVRWIFSSPTGARYAASGEYRGDYSWAVEFRPREIGRWSYTWRHDFTPDPYEGAEGVFDVVPPRDPGTVLEELQVLLGEAAEVQDGEARRDVMVRGLGLERAAMARWTPGAWSGDVGRRIRRALHRLRSRIWGEELPVPIPLEAHSRPWMNGSADGQQERVGTRADEGRGERPLVDALWRAVRKTLRGARRMMGRR